MDFKFSTLKYDLRIILFHITWNILQVFDVDNCLKYFIKHVVNYNFVISDYFIF